jgi:hypothetical protein
MYATSSSSSTATTIGSLHNKSDISVWATRAKQNQGGRIEGCVRAVAGLRAAIGWPLTGLAPAMADRRDLRAATSSKVALASGSAGAVDENPSRVRQVPCPLVSQRRRGDFFFIFLFSALAGFERGLSHMGGNADVGFSRDRTRRGRRKNKK